MNTFSIEALTQARAKVGTQYHEFLRVPALSCGIYHLEAGSIDPQSPHNEDEVYYIIRGRGEIRVGDENRPVATGDVIYVAKHVAHKFHSITQDLDVLVFFAPAETS
jgi:mannose-6-phosphate isomerase-like protein (cupin superfamily)